MGVEQKLGNMGGRLLEQAITAHQCHVADVIWAGMLRNCMMSASRIMI
jgi:hypothetical protein